MLTLHSQAELIMNHTIRLRFIHICSAQSADSHIFKSRALHVFAAFFAYCWWFQTVFLKTGKRRLRHFLNTFQNHDSGGHHREDCVGVRCYRLVGGFFRAVNERLRLA